MIEETRVQTVLNLLTEIGKMMINSRDHTAKIVRNIERIAEGLTYTGIVISVHKENKLKSYTLARTLKGKGLNFETVSAISVLSWDVLENRISIPEIKDILNQIKSKKVYTNLQLYALAPLASVALCMLFDGDWLQSLIVYFSTLFGYFARRTLMLRHHNHLFAFFVGATISNLFIHFTGVAFNIQVKEALVVSVL